MDISKWELRHLFAAEKKKIFSFTTIGSVGVALFCSKGHADGQMDRRAYEARLNVGFRSSFANAPKI